LQQDPRVSPLRLAAHLSLAFGLFCYLYWIWLRHTQTPRQTGPAAAIRIVTALIALQIILGAFVAGMDAGLIYNTWPLMDGDWMPPLLYPEAQSWYAHVPSVQWQHRSFAYVVSAAILGFVALNWRTGDKKWLIVFASILLLQFALGVFTLIYMVPISLASAHQLVALALLATSVRLCYAYPLRGHKNG
jgi:cytochrome c oxidase assembly protein subunit 15